MNFIYALSNAFVKVTGWIGTLFIRNKIYYADKTLQGRRIKGSAIIVSNHNTIYDFAIMLFVFPTRTLRCLMAELLFKKNIFLTVFLKLMGGIKVDRNAHNYSFVANCCKILRKGGVIEIYPESRIPQKGEEKPLPFKSSAAHIALESGAPIIPVYNSGNYFKKGGNAVIIGTPIDARELYDSSLGHTQNLENISEILRERVIELREELDRQMGIPKKERGVPVET